MKNWLNSCIEADATMLPLIIIIAIIAIIAWIAGSVILWLVGLLTAFIFFVVAIMTLYAFHKMDILDVDDNRWLLFTPFLAFFAGLGLDKIGVLSLKPLTLSMTANTPLNAEVVLLLVVIVLLVVDIIVSRRD